MALTDVWQDVWADVWQDVWGATASTAVSVAAPQRIRGYELSVWSDVEAATGSTRLAEIVGLSGATQTLSLDNDERFRLVAPRFDGLTGDALPWITHIRSRRVIRVEDLDTSEVWEWRISRVTDGRDRNGVAFIDIQADPILLDLRTANLVREQITGGVTYHNLGHLALTPAQIIDTFVLPPLTAGGVDYVSRGTMSGTDGVELSWDTFTPLELALAVGEQFPDLEMRLVRNGATDYQLNLERVGDGTTMPPAAIGRNLVDLTREELTDGFASVVIPKGGSPPDDVELMSIGDNGWRVTSSAFGGGTVTLGLDDAATGDLPIGFDDQLNDLYVEEPDGSLFQIVTSAASSGEITYSSGSAGPSVGEFVRIVADSDGTLLTELQRPAAVTTYGRAVGVSNDPTVTGARNYFAVGGFSDHSGWDDVVDRIRMLPCQLDGGHSSASTVDLKGLPQGLEIAADDVLSLDPQPDRVNPVVQQGPGQISSGATVGAGGTAQVTLAAGTMTGNDNDWVWIATGQNVETEVVRWPNGNLLPRYANVGVETELFAPGVVMDGNSTWTTGLSTSGTVDGDQLTTTDRFVDVTGLTASSYYPAGFDFTWTGSGGSTTRGGAVGFMTDANGAARLWIDESTKGAIAEDGDAVTLDYPSGPDTWAVSSGEHVLWWPVWGRVDTTFQHSNNSGGVLDKASASIPVRFVEGKGTVYFGAGFTVDGDGRTWEQTGTFEMPHIIIYQRALGTTDSFTSTTVHASDSSYANTADTPLHHDIKSSVSISSDTEFVFDLAGYSSSSNIDVPPARGEMWALRYMTVWLGPDSEPPVSPAWGPNELWLRANERLESNGMPPTRYTLTVRDLSKVSGFDPATEKPVLGADIPLEDTDLGIDVTARVVSIQYDLADPLNTRLVLQTNTRSAARSLVGKRYKSKRAENASEIGVTGIDVQPAVRETGARRALATPSTLGGTVSLVTFGG